MINTTLQYLARDKLYETEKPYSAEFEVEEHNGVKKTNYILSAQPVAIHAIQPSDKFSLDTNGFCIINAKTSLQLQDALTRPDAVESAYLNEIEAILCERFPEYSRLEPMEFVASHMPVFLTWPHRLWNMGVRLENETSDSHQMR
jgi:hypothetical protein